MKNTVEGQVIGFPISSPAQQSKILLRGFLPQPSGQTQISTSNEPVQFKRGKVISVINRMNKLGKKADSVVLGIREHVRLGRKITETVKGKLSLGAKIVQVGGVAKIFERNFSVEKGEKLMKASQCYLSTTAGPLAGLLFVSTKKIAFCSERSIKVFSPWGEFIRVPYKVVIPLTKIKSANKCENAKKPSQKYIEMVTEDGFDFWFMGFIDYSKTFRYLQQAISQSY